ncbi:hypothetical protein [Desulfosarcina sp. BuS5]|uniref:hypothetical protein n=1 Tax=Desulfosarcina sp. BuS5 TaxID=933262 RepID=UPI0023789814|nr:hypothetical protein [Desulfosarcina sp. BuS5]
MPVIAFAGVSCCFFERQLRQAFYIFHCFSTRRHLALLFAAFLVKSASHQQTLLQNAANSGFLFGNRCFYCHYSSIRLHLVPLSVTISQGVAYCFNWLCCKRQQTAVCSPTLHYLQAFNYAFSNPAALQKAGCRNQAGVYNKTLLVPR